MDVQAATLEEALRHASAQAPGLLDCLAADGRLKPGYIANLDGRQFIRDPQTPLPDGGSLLLLSSDAGG